MHYSGLFVRLAGYDDAVCLHALVTCKRALETRESNCAPRTIKPFFIPVAHDPPRAVRHMAAPELSPGEAKSGVMSHVAALEPSLVGEQGLEPRVCGSAGALPYGGARSEAEGTRQHRSPSLWGSGVRSRGARGSTRTPPLLRGGVRSQWRSWYIAIGFS
jgi:hypothetical protein